jgi:hypothetical protein
VETVDPVDDEQEADPNILLKRRREVDSDKNEKLHKFATYIGPIMAQCIPKQCLHSVEQNPGEEKHEKNDSPPAKSQGFVDSVSDDSKSKKICVDPDQSLEGSSEEIDTAQEEPDITTTEPETSPKTVVDLSGGSQYLMWSVLLIMGFCGGVLLQKFVNIL